MPLWLELVNICCYLGVKVVAAVTIKQTNAVVILIATWFAELSKVPHRT